MNIETREDEKIEEPESFLGFFVQSLVIPIVFCFSIRIGKHKIPRRNWLSLLSNHPEA